MTDALFDTFDPFDLIGGVPADLLDDDPERPEGAYLRIGDDTLADGAVVDLVDEAGPMGVAAWFAVLIAAKRARAFGVVDIHARTLGQTFGASTQDTMTAVDALERAGLVWLRRDAASPRQLTIRVRNWARWQSMTDAERTRLHRARMSRKTEPRSEIRDTVTETRTQGGVCHDTKTKTETKTETEPADVVPIARAREARQQDQPTGPHGLTTKWQPVLDHLDFLHGGDEGKMNWLVSDLAMNARRSGLDVDAYARAAEAMAAKLKAGWKPERPNALLGYLMKSAKGHRYTVTLPDVESEPTTDQKDHHDRPGSQYAFLD